LRNRVDAKENFGDLLQRIQKNTLDAFQHQDYPFDQLVEKLSIERDLSRSPIFDIWIQLDEARQTDEWQFNGLEVEAVELPVNQSKFDLAFYFEERTEGLHLELEYNIDLFQGKSIKRLLHHFGEFVQNLVAQPEQRICDIAYLSQEDETAILQMSSGPEISNPAGILKECFERQVAKTPDRRAISFEESYYTYRQLNEKTNQLANWLQKEYQIGPEKVVGVRMQRSDDYLISILAILKAGGAFVPVAVETPLNRTEYMLQTAEAVLLLTDEAFELETENACPIHCLSAIDHRSLSTQNLETVATAESLAYIIFTSGTTGRPKGAMVEQRGMMNHLYSKVNDFGIDKYTVVALTASISVDISVWQALVALLEGGCTQIYAQEVVLDPVWLMENVIEDEVTVLEVVPSYLNELLLVLESCPEAFDLSQLDVMIATGEALKKNLVERWFQLYPDIPMGNVYGPTEASDDITHLVLREYPADGNITIGKPIQNMRVYVLDDNDQLCPIGIKGEICVSGIGVGRGYINNAEKTAAAFQQDPYP
ncbi:MAG: AMP-binding protein, partial [Bacteroidota bacterium]